MKATTLILAVVCAVGFSSCCCQSQSMPPLRPMPSGDCCGDQAQPATQQPVQTPQTPVKQLPVQEGK